MEEGDEALGFEFRVSNSLGAAHAIGRAHSNVVVSLRVLTIS